MIKEILDYYNGYRAVNIKTFTGRQGTGWDADISKDGILIGSTTNHANGSCITFRIQDKVELENLIQYSQIISKDSFEITENFLNNLVEYELILKDIVKLAKKNILAFQPNSEKDENNIPVEYVRFKCDYSTVNRDYLLKKHPDIYIINDDLDLIKNIKSTKKIKIN